MSWPVVLLGAMCACSDGTRPSPHVPVAVVTVSPEMASIVVGDTLRLRASALDADGDTLGGRSVNWTSSDGGIATVDPVGLVTAITEGVATITASSDGESGRATIAVVAALEALQAKLDSLRWIAFAPTNFNPTLGMFPDETSLRADLEVLRAHGFDGIITFGSDGTLRDIPRLAQTAGFRGIIMGLFIGSQTQRREEIPNAKAAAAYVDGYAVGNEGLIGCGGSFYTADTLLAVMDELRASTGKPVTTSEQIADYVNRGPCRDTLLANGDWIFPIMHPFNNGFQDPVAGAQFTVDRFTALNALTGKRICAKETGWPTRGHPAATEQNQERYYSLLKDQPVCYAYFEAFDQPWKVVPQWESFWGLFRQDRSAKPFISANDP